MKFTLSGVGARKPVRAMSVSGPGRSDQIPWLLPEVTPPAPITGGGEKAARPPSSSCAHDQPKVHVVKVADCCAGRCSGGLEALASNERQGSAALRPDTRIICRENAAEALKKVGAKCQVTVIVENDCGSPAHRLAVEILEEHAVRGAGCGLPGHYDGADGNAPVRARTE